MISESGFLIKNATDVSTPMTANMPRSKAKSRIFVYLKLIKNSANCPWENTIGIVTSKNDSNMKISAEWNLDTSIMLFKLYFSIIVSILLKIL